MLLNSIAASLFLNSNLLSYHILEKYYFSNNHYLKYILIKGNYSFNKNQAMYY